MPNKLNGAFQVNDLSISGANPAAVNIKNNRIMVVYQGGPTNSQSTDIYGQVMTNDGVRVGDSFLVNTFTTGTQSIPGIAANNNGTSLVVWQSNGQSTTGIENVFGQLLDGLGNRIGSEFQISGSNGVFASIVCLTNDNFVVTWWGFDQQQNQIIYAQIIDSNGNKIGNTFEVGGCACLFNAPGYYGKSLAALPNGNFVTTWLGYELSLGGYNIFAHLHNASGASVGTSVVVSGNSSSPFTNLGAHSLSNGNVVINWGGSTCQLLDSSLNKVGAAITLGSNGGRNMITPLAGGSFIAVSGEGAQLYNATANPVGKRFATNGDPFTLSDGNFTVFGVIAGAYIIGQTYYMGLDLKVSHSMQTLSYIQNAPLVNLNPIAISTPGDTATVTMTLSSLDAGRLTTATSGNVTPTYDAGTGIWNASGNVDDLNAALSQASFVPTLRYNANFSVSIHVGDGINPSVNGSLAFVGTSLNRVANTVSTQFPVSDLSIPGGGANIAAANIGSNRVMVVYEVYQNNNYDIYGQIINNDGSKPGNSFRVNTFTTDNQLSPVIAANSSGISLVAWKSTGQASSESDIYGQLLDNSGNKIGNEFQISVYALGGGRFSPSVAALTDGNFVVTWRPGNGDFTVTGQIISSTGSKVGTSFIVTKNARGYDYATDVAALPNGNFVVTWAQDKVVVRLFNATGVPIGIATEVSPCYSSACGAIEGYIYPAVRSLSNGNIVVSWNDADHGQAYCQLLDSSLNKIGFALPLGYTGTRVSDFLISKIAPLSEGRFAAMTLEGGQVFDATGVPLGNKFKTLRAQALLTLSNGNFVTFDSTLIGQVYYGGTELKVSHPLQVLQYIKNADYIHINPIIISTPLDQVTVNMTVSDLDAGALTTKTSGGVTSSYDSQTGIWQASGKVDDVNVVLSETNFVPNQNYAGNFTIGVKVQDAVNPIVNGSLTVTTRVLNQIASPIGNPFQISNSTLNPYVGAANIGNDKVIVVYEVSQDTYDIYGQIINNDGNKLGNSFRINTYTTDSQTYPIVAANKNGVSLVAWQSTGQATLNGKDIYGQLFDNNGTKVGSEFRISIYSSSGERCCPTIAALANDNFVVTWNAGIYGPIKGQIISPSGNKIGNPFIVTNNDLNYSPYACSVSALPNGNFVATWHQGAVVVQLFNSSGAAVSSIVEISECYISSCSGVGYSSYVYPTVSVLNNNNVAVSWNWNNQEYCQLLNGTLNKIGSIISLDNSGVFHIPRVAPFGAGGFVAITKEGGQIFDATGIALGNKFNVTDTNAVLSLSNGNFALFGGGPLFAQYYSVGGIDLTQTLSSTASVTTNPSLTQSSSNTATTLSSNLVSTTTMPGTLEMTRPVVSAGSSLRPMFSEAISNGIHSFHLAWSTTTHWIGKWWNSNKEKPLLEKTRDIISPASNADFACVSLPKLDLGETNALIKPYRITHAGEGTNFSNRSVINSSFLNSDLNGQIMLGAVILKKLKDVFSCKSDHHTKAKPKYFREDRRDPLVFSRDSTFFMPVQQQSSISLEINKQGTLLKPT